MHVEFEATVQHTETTIDEMIRKLDVSERLRSELPVFHNEYKSALTPATPGVEKSKNATTRFLALGKVGGDPDNTSKRPQMVNNISTTTKNG
jgi:hypothetical protein